MREKVREHIIMLHENYPESIAITYAKRDYDNALSLSKFIGMELAKEIKDAVYEYFYTIL